jgi:hypothetical protein
MQEVAGGNLQAKCLGSDYMTTYGTAKPLVTQAVSDLVRKPVPLGTRWVEFTVRGATLVIQPDPNGADPSATVGMDYAIGSYSRDWGQDALNVMRAFSAGAATLEIFYWGIA